MTRKVTTITTQNEAEGMDDFYLDVEQVGRQPITVMQNGIATEVTSRKAILQKLTQSGLQGSSQSIRQANELHQEAARRRKRDIEVEVERWTKLKTRQAEKFARYRKENGQDPLEFPHPDDIEIDRSSGVRLRGPMTLQEHQRFMHTQRFICACLLQNELNQRVRTTSGEPAAVENGMLIVAFALNSLLPLRLRLSDDDLTMQSWRAQRETKRALLRNTYRAWQALGYDVKRGWTCGSTKHAVNVIELAVDTAEIMAAPQTTQQDKIHKTAAAILERFG